MQSFAHCVCVRSRAHVCVCVCVREREREREREKDRVTSQLSVQPIINRLNRGLLANTYKHHHGVCHATLFPSRVWTDRKTKYISNYLLVMSGSRTNRSI